METFLKYFLITIKQYNQLWSERECVAYITLMVLVVIVSAICVVKGRFTLGRAVAVCLLMSCIWHMLAVTLFTRYTLPSSKFRFLLIEDIRDFFAGNIQVQVPIYMNMVLFVPFGMLLNPVFTGRVRLHHAVIAGFLGSLYIESMQYVMRRGIFDVTDLITNTLGCVIGWSVTYVFTQIMKRCLAVKG